VSELTVVDITQASQVDMLLAQAMERRSVGCTALNEQSSRSHMVFTLKLEGVNEAKGKRISGALNLIDLAGSERVKDSGAAGVRMKEAQAINTSLSALGKICNTAIPAAWVLETDLIETVPLLRPVHTRTLTPTCKLSSCLCLSSRRCYSCFRQ
jgi:hypothetical protein